MEALRYITDASGVKTAVVIPMKQLLRLSEVMDELRKLEEISQNIRVGIKEARLIEAGHKTGLSAHAFLDEL